MQSWISDCYQRQSWKQIRSSLFFFSLLDRYLLIKLKSFLVIPDTTNKHLFKYLPTFLCHSKVQEFFMEIHQLQKSIQDCLQTTKHIIIRFLRDCSCQMQQGIHKLGPLIWDATSSGSPNFLCISFDLPPYQNSTNPPTIASMIQLIQQMDWCCNWLG